MTANSFCVLVPSSDATKDVFEIAFANQARMWRDCDWPRYVSFVSAKQPWRQRVATQLDSLPGNFKYVLLIVEDCMLTAPVDGTALNSIAVLVERDDLAHVRLTPVVRNLPGQTLEWLRRRFDKRPLRRLSYTEPYYSSFLIGIWRRDYLKSIVLRPGTVWDFEHTVTSEPHYALWRPFLQYKCLVGKGQWYRQTPKWLAQQGLSLPPTPRRVQSRLTALRSLRENIVFQLVGFSNFRLRRRFGLFPKHREIYSKTAALAADNTQPTKLELLQSE